MTSRLTPEMRTEIARKLVHAGSGLFAFTLGWLSWSQALGLALAALAFNALVLPRIGGRRLFRDSEHARGWSIGMIAYPLSIVILLLVLPRRMDVVAAAWALMAFGDGSASVVGMLWGRRPLPWNPRKTWEGVAAHVVFGGLLAILAFFLATHSRPDAPHHLGWVALVILPTAMVTALLESVDTGVDDNLAVPLVGGLVIVTLESVGAFFALGSGSPGPHAAACVGLSLVLAGVAGLRRRLTPGGALAAAIVGSVVSLAGWGAFATLLAFYLLGTGATRVGRAVKEARGIAEDRGGRRAWGNVVANGGFAAVAAILALGSTRAIDADLAHVALVAALATAAFDTVSSEIGKAHGRTTVLVPSMRRVSPGTEGAVSLEGTAAGFAASIAVGLVGVGAGLLGMSGVQAGLASLGGGDTQPPGRPLLGLAAVVAGALAGSTFESLVGSACERRGHRVHGDLLNFANTVVGALVAVMIAIAVVLL